MTRGKVRRLRLDRLNLAQPPIRSGRTRLSELAASVEEVGVLVPLVVRQAGELLLQMRVDVGFWLRVARAPAVFTNWTRRRLGLSACATVGSTSASGSS